jgi:hypothetical protein
MITTLSFTNHGSPNWSADLLSQPFGYINSRADISDLEPETDHRYASEVLV